MDVTVETAASSEVESVRFGFYSEDEVKRISVKKITKPDRLDAKNSAVPGGLFDPAMGPISEADNCKSCGQNSALCPGHFGHIELAKPLFNPLLFPSLKKLLDVTCFCCHKFRLNREQVDRYVNELELLTRGDVARAKDLKDSGTKMFDSHGDDEMTETTSVDKSSLPERENKTWTSIQLKEVLSIFSNLMKKKEKKCKNCGMKSPKIISRMAGWLIKVTNASTVNTNAIADFKLKGDGHVHESNETGVSGLDEELNLPGASSKGSSNQMKRLSDDTIRKMVASPGEKPLLTTEVESILKDLWKNEPRFCSLLCDFQQNSTLAEKKRGYEMFFLKSLLVTPNRFRPSTSSSLGIMEHPQNVLLGKVQEANLALQHDNADSNNMDILKRWNNLQASVNVLYDSTTGFGRSEKDTHGIKQLLEKKEGILRQKMMGKRVNYACRSVISPDPYLAVNEIGIPPVFATRLTYPEKVTPWNAKKLQEAVNNGADIHPGATHYRDHNNKYKLQVAAPKRRAIAKMLPASRGSISQQGKDPKCKFENKVVYRHLQDGDIVLVNRQPTLHKPSMMAHFVRVLPGERTIRMHYANCSTYNADFDGDEMNVHFPQDEISRAEAINIVDANKQYIGPRSGDAVRGLIQDHIVGAVLLTKLDTFLSREEYSQLVYGSCVPCSTRSSHQSGKKVCVIKDDDSLKLVPPAIWKPKPLWTGKQVITTILNHLTKGRPPFTVGLRGKISEGYLSHKESHDSKAGDPELKKEAGDPELKKKPVEPEIELYIHDNELVKGMIDKNQFGKYGLVHTVHELYGADKAGMLLSTFSRLFTLFLQLHGFTCGVDDLLVCRESDKKRMEILATSEEKSKEIHMTFISAGADEEDPVKIQTEVEKVVRRNGESRLDIMMSNELKEVLSAVNSLFPYGLEKPFTGNCLSLMTATGAKGSAVNMNQISLCLGQQSLEGKRVPRMVSGKTLPCFSPWNTSARAGGFISDRFLTGLRPQEYYFHCMAGREGLVDTAVKTSRSGYLQRCLIKSLESLKVSYDYTVRDVDGSVIQFCYGEDGVDVHKSSFLDRVKELADNREAALDKFGSDNGDHLLSKSNGYITELPKELIDRARKFLELPKDEKCCRYDIKKEELMKLLKAKYLAGLVDPGEAVGVIAAQSIGESTTQLTLNTFHHAGRAEVNVTLGVPRLKELLMTASENISTPFMMCPLYEDRTREDADRVAAKLRRVRLADIVEKIEVCTVPFHNNNGRVSTLYKLQMKLYPQECYPSQSELTVDECQATLKTVFVDAMEVAIGKHLDLLHKINEIRDTTVKDTESSLSGATEESEIQGTTGEDAGVSDVDDENEDDLGTDAEKRKQQENDEMEYDDDVEKEESMDGESEEETKFKFKSDDDPVESDEEPGETEEGHVPDSGNKGMKPKNKHIARKLQKEKETMDGNIEEQRQVPKARKGRKKLKLTVHVETTNLNFEVHYVLHEEPHILLAQIAQKTTMSIFVKTCRNIDRCTVTVKGTEKKPRYFLQTAGVNFEALWNLEDYLNIRNLTSNDVHAMLTTYGVEAARAIIIKEVRDLFGEFGVDVNIRHLSLVADFMTFDGGYRPMSRMGMGQFSTSPFGKMTYETATKFITEAAYHGETDTLEGPSASVCLGKPAKVGTGCFGLLQNIGLEQPLVM